jgi:ubiquinone/menaquinone biosynthesis C-methylase UbiE
MTIAELDKKFAGNVPEIYERMMVPLVFEPYAEDLADRVIQQHPQQVLEVAAGTGVVTRELARRLPSNCQITATDLNGPMLDVAQRIGTGRSVSWRQADALQLPFEDESFDVVVCQFGVMFFPDRVRGYSEMRRVLKQGGQLLFNVWDRIETSEFTKVVSDVVAQSFPQNPPDFIARIPHGYYDENVIRRDLQAAAFSHPATFETVTKISRASSARIPAIAFCQGTPIRNEIEARDAKRLAEVTDASEQALLRRFGSGAIEGRIQAIVISVSK